jgi:hypothetical protein
MSNTTYHIVTPTYSRWKCYMFGNTPNGMGIIYIPLRGNEPNWFVRWMMKVCFACTWVKEGNT